MILILLAGMPNTPMSPNRSKKVDWLEMWMVTRPEAS